MRIRLGGQTPITKHNRTPNNEGMVEHANTELDYLVPSANAAYENALQVDGVLFTYWRKTKEGRICSCKHDEPDPVEPNSQFREFNRPDPSDDPNSITVRGSWDKQRVKPNVHGKELGVDIGLIDPDDASGKQQVKNYPAIDQNEINAFLNGPADARLLEGGEGTTACGICFGTGYTNGYSLYNGVRITLDALNAEKTNRFSVDRDEHPYLFTSSGDSADQYVEWTIELPLFIKTEAVLVRNNLVSAGQLRATVFDNNAWVPLTKDWLNNVSDQSRTIKVRVVTSGVTSSVLKFSHVEIILQQADFKLTQVGQLQKSRSFSSPEPVSSLEFNLPPSMADVSESDIIVDYKYRMVWLITDVTDLKTARQKIMAWTASTRSLTRFDIPSLLKLSQMPEYGIAYSGNNEE